jgi:hypothetical protein
MVPYQIRFRFDSIHSLAAGLVATVYQKTFLMDGYVAKDCGADYDGATGKGTAGDCTACLESTVTGGSAARMLAVEDDVTRCTQVRALVINSLWCAERQIKTGYLCCDAARRSSSSAPPTG